MINCSMTTMSSETCCHRVSVLTCGITSDTWGPLVFAQLNLGTFLRWGSVICYDIIVHPNFVVITTVRFSSAPHPAAAGASLSHLLLFPCDCMFHPPPPLPLLYGNLYITHHPSSSFCLPPPLHLSSLRYVGVKLRLYFPFWYFIVNALLHPIQSRCCGNTV